MQLILTEKPSVAKDIASVLGAKEKSKHYYAGKGVLVTWALGHLLTLQMPEDINKDWAKWQMEDLPMLPKHLGTKPLPKSMAQLKAIKGLVNRSDVTSVVIATDAGREGELVARWILNYAKNTKPTYRLWISSQTDKAIKAGFDQLKPAHAYDALYDSALSRSKADWLVGLNVTRALTVKYQDDLSAGRVQTPSLALVAKRDKAIASFTPEKYYQVSWSSGRIKATFGQHFKEKAQAEAFLKKVSAQPGKVVDLSSKVKKQAAPLPYDLTLLQREANTLYGFSAKKTLSLTQALYETHKIVTYPRTDSQYLTKDMKQTMGERLQAVTFFDEKVKLYIKQGAKMTHDSVYQDAKVGDHHALIPTEQKPQLARLSADELKIYRLIVQRFLDLFAGDYVYQEEKVTVSFGKEQLSFRQSQVLEAGFKAKDLANQEKHQAFVLDQALPSQMLLEEKMTTPPTAMTEASLLQAMEAHQLGTPATRAEIIEKLIASQLMNRLGKGLKVTPKGTQLLDLVNPSLVSPDLTEKWEKDLKAIEAGKLKASVFLKGIEADTRALVSEIKASQKAYKDHALTGKKCPECGALLKERQTKQGTILVCSNHNCSYRKDKEGKLTNHRCPQCHKKMILLEGENGKFFSCSTCAISEKVETLKKNKKMTKHETKRLLNQINAQQEEAENPFALAFKGLSKD